MNPIVVVVVVVVVDDIESQHAGHWIDDGGRACAHLSCAGPFGAVKEALRPSFTTVAQ